MKYQLTPTMAQFDKDGFVVVEGWALIYNTDAQTGEFINATYEYVAEGIGLPDHVCLDAPKNVKENQAIVRNGQQWTYPKDLRGTIIYSTETGAETTMQEVGDIPEGYTTLKSTSEFDVWNGEKWVLDTEKQHQYNIDVATSRKKQLLSEANEQISYLQDAIDADIATDEEKTLFAEWKKYRVLLNRVDLNQAPNITFPTKPELS